MGDLWSVWNCEPHGASRQFVLAGPTAASAVRLTIRHNAEADMPTRQRLKPSTTPFRGRGVTAAQRSFKPQGEGSNPSDLT